MGSEECKSADAAGGRVTRVVVVAAAVAMRRLMTSGRKSD